MLLKTYHGDWTKSLCTGVGKKSNVYTLWPVDGISC